MPERGGSASGALAGALYVVVTLLMLLQRPGTTTYDTRAELTERPGDFLAGAFTLWHPESNFGEFQNQAYGFLFPQGTWFVLTDLVGMPGWVSQRLWSALLLVVACEGARRAAAALGLPAPAALLAGIAYLASPRLLGTVVVQTGESLPGAVMPWLVLAVVLHLRGAISARRSALLSGAAVVCMGGVNAVETAGSLPLAIILVVWALRRGLVGRRYVAGWFLAVGLACAWWALPLLLLARYAPPFYEYVESATDTTAVIGWSEAARGDSSWIAYVLSGDQPWWPAAFHLAVDPLLVGVAAAVAGIGLAGLALLGTEVRRPLMLAAVLGLGCLTVAHGGIAGAPVAEPVRALLDGTLQIFRNVHKIDPVVRLPLAVGFGYAGWQLTTRATGRLPALVPWQPALLMVPVLLVLTLARPFVVDDARTPGWDEIADHWQDARSYLAENGVAEGGDGRALVVPGSSFAQQDWGWTIDEPLTILGGVATATRSQVPLIPGQSIRFLSALDQLISTGRATEALGGQLARAGITHVVIRRDLLLGPTRSPHPGGAAVSLARAGLERVAGFGTTANGAAVVEVFEVPGSQPVLRAAPVADVRTVRGAPESVLGLQGAGLVAPGQPTVLEGEDGWAAPADVVTDSNQRRERAFGGNDEALSAVLTADEPWRTDRAAHDYPAVPGSPPVVARYDGLDELTASSAQGYADNFGPVTPQTGPYAAVDGDLDTHWVTSHATDPEEQWLRLTFDEPRAIHEVTITTVADDPVVVPVRTLEVVAGDQRVRAPVNVSGAPTEVPLDGSEVDGVEVRVVEAATASGRARVGLREVSVDDLQPRRTLVVPGAIAPDAAWTFGSAPGRRACVITLGSPDCDVFRIRAPEEQGGLDRTFTLDASQRVRLTGQVVARGTPEAARLLDVVQHRLPVTGSSTYGLDPRVSPRFAYDGQPTTAWVSADDDLFPTLTFRWRSPRTVRGIEVVGGPEDAPAAAVVTAGRRVQRVALPRGGGAVPIRPVTTRKLHVRFEKASAGRRVVVPEIRLTGLDVTRPFLPDAPTGAVCGLGPEVRIDGERVPTRVTGTLADVVNGSPLELEACRLRDGATRTVTLGPGEHRLFVPPSAEYQVVEATGTPEGADPLGTAEARSVEVVTWDSTSRSARVSGGPATLLHLPENFNSGWVAEVDGEPLEPLRVDGWQQGWVLPAGDATTVELRYAPQRTYAVLLPAGLATSGAVLLGGLAALVVPAVSRARGARTGRASWRDWRPASRQVSLGGWLLALALAAVVLGPSAAAGLLAGSLAGDGRRRVPVAIAGGLLLALSGLLDAGLDGSVADNAADVAAALGVGVVAGVAAGRPARRPAAREGDA